MASKHLLLFTRWPEPGQTKTRLIPALGKEGAAELQEWLTGHTLFQARQWAKDSDCEIRVVFTGAASKKFKHWLGPDITLLPQDDGDLGDRLSSATQNSFQEGAQHVVMIGIDCPGIDAAYLSKAFNTLQSHHAVIGPATDGGYTLLGCNQWNSQLFEDISWGTEKVLEQTQLRLQKLDWQTHCLPTLDDIDEEQDLQELEKFQTAEQTPGLSVIIPARNEEGSIKRAIDSALSEADEVIVVDGGSSDATIEIAKATGATVLTSPPGRGMQMNEGAQAASYDTLLFLHADSIFPKGAGSSVRTALQNPDTALTAFQLGIQGSRKAYRCIETAVRFRSSILKRPYGDQALALKRETFTRLGGYATLPLLEDLDLVKRAARRGKIQLLPFTVQVSDRRWKTKGVLRTTLINQAILLGNAFGLSAERLRSWY